MRVGVGEVAGSGAVSNGVADGGCGAIVGTGTFASFGSDREVEANWGVSFKCWDGGRSDIKNEGTAKFGVGRKILAESVVDGDKTRAEY